MIDSHSHVSRCPVPPEELMENAAAAGVERILTVGLEAVSNREQIALCERFDGLYAAVGRHPNDADGFGPEDAADIEQLAAHPKVRAIGETGLDFYRDTADPEAQRLAFTAQAEIAVRTGLPLVIHVRDGQGRDEAVTEVFETLHRVTTYAADGLTVILHCFSAPGWVDRAAERGWYCSFAGNVTYPANRDLREAAAKVPDDLILVETDSPYLTPQSKRRERNQPANVVETARCVAEQRGITYGELEAIVTANAARLFRW